MDEKALHDEQRLMRMMRKTLTSIVRDTAPRDGNPSPLTEATVRTLGSSPGAVDVLFFDVPRHNWATGGVLWSDKAAASPPPAAGG